MPAARKTAETAPEAPDRSPEHLGRIVTLLKLVTTPTRGNILFLLAGGEMNAGDVAAGLGAASQPNISGQLKLLRLAGLVASERRGKEVFYVLTEAGRTVVRAYHALADSPHF